MELKSKDRMIKKEKRKSSGEGICNISIGEMELLWNQEKWPQNCEKRRQTHTKPTCKVKKIWMDITVEICNNCNTSKQNIIRKMNLNTKKTQGRKLIGEYV